MILSYRQQAIMDYQEAKQARRIGFNLLVNACAGSGKTATLMEMIRRTPSHMAILYLAFGHDIKVETDAKVAEIKELTGRDCDVRTLNGMGFRIYREYHPKAFLDNDKTYKILAEHIDNSDAPDYDVSAVVQLVSLAKAHGLVPSFCRGDLLSLTPDNMAEWNGMVDKFDVGADDSKVPMIDNIRVARRVLCIGTTSGQYKNILDFDDMLYLPMAHRMVPRFRFDLVLVDEAQDLSKINRYLVRVVCKNTGSRVFVGDRAQAIFGFRGADSDSMDNIKAEFLCDELPLDVTFRCPNLVVALLQTLVPNIFAKPGAIDGIVDHLDEIEPRTFAVGDIVVCRNRAPLVKVAYHLIANRVGATVLGSDIGKGLVKLVDHLLKTTKATNVRELGLALDAWEEKEAGDAEHDGKEKMAANIRDRADCVRTIIANMVPTSKASRVASAITAMFTDDGKGKVTLMTIHKSKGLEANNVWVLDDHLMPSSWATQEWEMTQERNLKYVAYSRPRQVLRFIRSDSIKAPVKMAA